MHNFSLAVAAMATVIATQREWGSTEMKINKSWNENWDQNENGENESFVEMFIVWSNERSSRVW